MVVVKNEPQAESRSESAAGHTEGKVEADASTMRTDGWEPSSRRKIGLEHRERAQRERDRDRSQRKSRERERDRDRAQRKSTEKNRARALSSKAAGSSHVTQLV